MSKFVDLFSNIVTFLAADVASAGTFNVPYPAGTTQQDFDTGLGAATGGYAIVNDSDKWLGSAGKVSFTFGAGNITVTNSSGVTWTANSKVQLQIDRQDGNSVSTIQIPMNLASIANGALLNPGLRLGIVGTLEYFEAYVQTPATTAAKLATINPTIDGVDVVGGALALTSANCTPAGVILPAPLITGANALKAASKLGFKGSAVTAFVEGVIVLNIRIRHALSNNY
ncbi:MAG: hypothetical protein ACXWLZ_03570 [Rhizomicrobium sp.]